MITTVTLNPALDITYELEALHLGASNRVAAVHERPGGKGVNVSRVLTALGHDTVATGWATEAFNDDLRASGVAAAFVAARRNVRRTIAVADGSEITMLLEPGSAVDNDAVGQLSTAIVATDPDVVALCGSLPAGLPAATVAELLVEVTRATTAIPVVDTSGATLHAALQTPGVVLKVNHHEAAEVLAAIDDSDAADDAGVGASEHAADRATEADVETSAETAAQTVAQTVSETVAESAVTPAGIAAIAATVRRLVALGHPTVVVTAGSDGLVIAHQSRLVHAVIPTAIEGNPTGAGDAATAALCVGLTTGDGIHAIARAMVAVSAAAVRQPLAGAVDPDDVAVLTPTVILKDLPCP